MGMRNDTYPVTALSLWHVNGKWGSYSHHCLNVLNWHAKILNINSRRRSVLMKYCLWHNIVIWLLSANISWWTAHYKMLWACCRVLCVTEIPCLYNNRGSFKNILDKISFFYQVLLNFLHKNFWLSLLLDKNAQVFFGISTKMPFPWW